MKKIMVILLTFSFIFSQPIFADDLQDVKSIVSKSIDIAIALIKDKKLDKTTRNQKIIDTLSPFFDFEVMAKLCLGKTHWVSMNSQNQDEFVNLFVKKLQDSLLEKLDLYTDEEVAVEEAKQVKNRIYVVTHMVSKDDKMEMIFKFHKSRDRGWLVYDIEILGVSIVQTYRTQFASYLKENSMNDLLAKLKETDSFQAEPGKK